MAGLLDYLNSEQGVLGAALLAAAAPRAGGRNTGAGLLDALGAVQGWRDSNTRRTSEAEDREMRRRMMEAQIAETQAQQQQRAAEAQRQQQAMARQQQFQGALGSLFAPTSPQQAMAGGGGPSVGNAARIGQPQQGQPNWQQLAAQFPDQVDLLKKLAESQNFGRQEVARTVEGMDAQGRPSTMQFDKYGGQVGGALPQWKAPVQADTGGALNFVDPVNLKLLQSFGKTNTPDALLSAQTAMRGQNMSDARSRERNQIDRDAVGKVDWKQDVNGNWIALPKEISGSGPVTPITTTTAGKREMQARNALDIIDQAGPLIDKATSSYLGAGVDQGLRAFGMSTAGGDAAGQLKALEGALMMAQPRMEGPQSDKDTQLYRQMAAQIGDPTVPASVKKAALAEVRSLHEKYAGRPQQGAQQGPTSSAAPRRIQGDAEYNALPSGAVFVGPDGVTRRKP